MTILEPACSSSPEAAGLHVEALPFAQIPQQSKLFLDYQTDATALRRFYPHAVRRHYDLVHHATHVLENYTCDRRAVCDALERLNRSWNAGEATLENIARLRDARTVAVVTGQQAGLFTGALYTIYKALSAIKLARCLTTRGVEAVPVFWIATEDHDWEEVRFAQTIGCDGRLATCELPAELHPEGMSVGALMLDDSIEAAITRLLDVLPSTEFIAELKELLHNSYKSGKSFGEAFARMMTSLMTNFGLIILDPLDAELKRLAAPLYAQAALRAADIARALVERSRALEADGYHAQVLTGSDSFPLFFHTEDNLDKDQTASPASSRRVAITRTPEGAYLAKGTNQIHSTEEWASLAQDSPEHFSPNVTLRGVVQDYLLPTVAYFGGAAEIAYFAQTAEVYRLLERPVTPILHRASLTVIEPRTVRTLERYDLHLRDFFDDFDTLIRRVVEGKLNTDGARRFDDAERTISEAMTALRDGLAPLDSTLVAASETRHRKINYHLEALRKGFHRAQMQRDRAAHRQLERAQVALYPERALQERHLNITSLLARHGLYCLDWLYDAIDLGLAEHQIVYL